MLSGEKRRFRGRRERRRRARPCGQMWCKQHAPCQVTDRAKSLHAREHEVTTDVTSDVRSQALNAFVPTFPRRRQPSRRDLIKLSLGLAVGSLAGSWGFAAAAQKRAQVRNEVPIEELMQ